MCTINHDKKAIFINIPKTGRTYISSNLVKYYGFTEYLQRRPDHEEYCNTTCNFWFFNKTKGILEYYKTSKYLNDIMNMNEEKWNAYTKFCFFRNPIYRCLSGYNYILSCRPIEQLRKINPSKEIEIISFEKFVQNYKLNDDFVYMHTFMPQYKHMIDENNNFFIDFVGNFDDLENDFIKILKLLKFENIIHDKNHQNVTDYDKTECFSENTIKNIKTIYKEDYEFINKHNLPFMSIIQ